MLITQDKALPGNIISKLWFEVKPFNLSETGTIDMKLFLSVLPFKNWGSSCYDKNYN